MPPLPESDAKILKGLLKQILNSISIQPIQNFDEMSAEMLSKLAEHQQMDLESPTKANLSYPLLFGNDVDSVDVAIRCELNSNLWFIETNFDPHLGAMVKFFHSPNLLADFQRHTRTLRLYPRPIVTIQSQQVCTT